MDPPTFQYARYTDWILKYITAEKENILRNLDNFGENVIYKKRLVVINQALENHREFVVKCTALDEEQR